MSDKYYIVTVNDRHPYEGNRKVKMVVKAKTFNHCAEICKAKGIDFDRDSLYLAYRFISETEDSNE